MFKQFSDGEVEEIYRGLKMLIGPEETKDIFHNRDPRHTCYIEGMTGRDSVGFSVKTQSQHFKLLSALSRELKKRGLVEASSRYPWWTDFTDCEDYCRFVFEAYDPSR